MRAMSTQKDDHSVALEVLHTVALMVGFAIVFLFFR